MGGHPAPGLRMLEQAGLVAPLGARARGAQMGRVERLVSARRALAAPEARVRGLGRRRHEGACALLGLCARGAARCAWALVR